MLAGQYPDYLKRQISAFLTGKRKAMGMGSSLKGLTDRDIENLLAYLSIKDD